VDPSSNLNLDGAVARVRLSCSFHAPTFQRATALAADLRRVDAQTPRIRRVNTMPASRREWVVTITTPEIPLSVRVLRRREAELLEIQESWPGCRFLGWRTLGIERDCLRTSARHQPSAA
jgi:hypothetical protein